MGCRAGRAVPGQGAEVNATPSHSGYTLVATRVVATRVKCRRHSKALRRPILQDTNQPTHMRTTRRRSCSVTSVKRWVLMRVRPSPSSSPSLTVVVVVHYRTARRYITISRVMYISGIHKRFNVASPEVRNAAQRQPPEQQQNQPSGLFMEHLECFTAHPSEETRYHTLKPFLPDTCKIPFHQQTTEPLCIDRKERTQVSSLRQSISQGPLFAHNSVLAPTSGALTLIVHNPRRLISPI